jgi:broad specificity phosphatase PhoE
VALGERGQRQAAALAAALAVHRPTAVVSSGMRRAVETARPLASACGLALRVEPDLHERRVGGLSGTHNRPQAGIWPDTLRRWLAGETAFSPPDSESFDAVRDRVLPVIRRLAVEHSGGSVAVVAHGLVCKVLLLSILPGKGPGDWLELGPVRNCSVTELEFDGSWRAARLLEVPPEVAAVQ